MSEEEQKQEISPLDRAESIVRRLEDANRRSEELIKKQEEIAARAMLGGRSESAVKTAEQIAKEDEDARVAEVLKRYRK